MDCLSRCCSVYDTRASLFTRHTSLVSHLPSISLHSIAPTTRDFLFAFVRNPPKVLISSKFSWRISCEAISTNQSHLNPQIEEKRQRRHNAMKHFLLEECCFSSSEITLLMNKVPGLFRRKSTDRARQVLQMLRDCGFTVKQIKKAILRSPPILSFSVDDYLKPKIEYFKTLGIAEEDLNNLVSRNPRILSLRLDETLDRRILFLLKLFGSKDKLFEALRKAPWIACCDVDLMNTKLKILENAGLLEHEIKEILDNNPQFLCSSVGKLEKNMKFLTGTMGLKPTAVVKYPVLLNFSVDKRLRPRYMVYQYLKLHAPEDLTTGIFTTLIKSEEDFTEKFLSSSPKVKMLYEKYKDKTAGIEIPELLPTHQSELGIER